MISQSTLGQLAQRSGQLIYLGIAPEVRLCSRGRVDALGQTWEAADITVEPQVGLHGVESLKITLNDIDFTWAWRLRHAFRPGIVCRWHLLYGAKDGWETQQYFDGVVNTLNITPNSSVHVGASLATGDTAFVPRVPFESPYSLSRGSELVINGTMYRVE